MKVSSLVIFALLLTSNLALASTEGAPIVSSSSGNASAVEIDTEEMQKTRNMVFKYMVMTAGLDFLKGIVEIKCFKKEFKNGVEVKTATNSESCTLEKQLQREKIRELLTVDSQNLTEEDREILRRYFVEVLT